MGKRKLVIEAVLGDQVVKVVSDGTEKGTRIYGDDQFWAMAMARLSMGGPELIAGTQEAHEVGYTPLGLMAAMSWGHSQYLIFTRVPKDVQDYLSSRCSKHEDGVFI